MKRGHPKTTNVRKSERVGPDYAETRYDNPVNAGIEFGYEEGKENKSIDSPNGQQFTLNDLPIHKNKYDKYWDGD